ATRALCRLTFDRFMHEYGALTYAVKDNLYAVPEDESLLDSGTIKTIFPPLFWKHEEVETSFLHDTSMVWRTQERYISPVEAKKFFSDQLSPLFRQNEFTSKDVAKLKCDFDLVIDCTNNALLKPSNNEYFETVAMFLYNVQKPLPFGALTYIDGPLFSFYPFHDGTISLSHVVHSVATESIVPIREEPSVEHLEQLRHKAENHVRHYWPDFSEHLSRDSIVLSMKSKRSNASAYRAPLFKQQDNLLSCYTGKIQGIYLIEERVLQALGGL
ncbi:hypothetical protein MEN98_21960, partial [Dolichospermum sp. ST_sed8]|nr:hypothetical protein [Dolichospermum sp. ST_sed8]